MLKKGVTPIRDLGERILLTEATRSLLESGDDSLGSRGVLELRGKAAPIAVYAPPANARRAS